MKSNEAPSSYMQYGRALQHDRRSTRRARRSHAFGRGKRICADHAEVRVVTGSRRIEARLQRHLPPAADNEAAIGPNAERCASRRAAKATERCAVREISCCLRQGASGVRKVLIGAAAVLVFAGLVAFESHAAPQSSPSPTLPLGTQIYQQRFEEVQAELRACRQTVATWQQPRTAAEDAYARRYYAQESEIRDVELAIYRWQISAANVVLALMSLLTMAAVIFCGYQLWRGQRLSKLPPSLIEIELSVSKLKMQTSLVGVAVLVASYGFLLVFTREIYQLRSIERAPTASVAGTIAVPASGAATR